MPERLTDALHGFGESCFLVERPRANALLRMAGYSPATGVLSRPVIFGRSDEWRSLRDDKAAG